MKVLDPCIRTIARAIGGDYVIFPPLHPTTMARNDWAEMDPRRRAIERRKAITAAVRVIEALVIPDEGGTT